MGESSKQRKWQREEVVVLVTEYFRTKNLTSEEIVDSQKKISSFLRHREEIITGLPVSDVFRDYAGIHMQSGRIRCLDPETKYCGMQGTRLQTEIVQEYLEDPKKLIAEAEVILNDMGNKTIDYYDSNADVYFRTTVDANMAPICDKFLKFVKPEGTIVDVGTGSGRDLKYFLDRGYSAEGIDLSQELFKRAAIYSGGKIACVDIRDWRPSKKYDGVWANASLLHLPLNEIEKFILRLSDILEIGGVAYISMKSGIANGYDDKGRYFSDFTEDKVQQILSKSTALRLIECWRTKDELCRENFEWLNFIISNNQ